MPNDGIAWREWPLSERLTPAGRLVRWMALTPNGELGLVHISLSGSLGQTVLVVPADRHDHRAKGWRFLRVDLEVIRGRGPAVEFACIALEQKQQLLTAAEGRIADLERQLADLRRGKAPGEPHAG